MQGTFASNLMSRWRVIGLALILVAGMIPAHAAEAPAAGPALNLFYMARRGSALEPCGCHTKQRGGLQYEAALYQRHPGVPAVRVDAGEWTSVSVDASPVDSMKTRYLLRALAMLDLDAVNVGVTDIAQNRDWFLELGKAHPEALAPLISANIFFQDDPTSHPFQASRIVTRETADGKTVRIGIVGVTSLEKPARRNTAAAPREKLETNGFLVLPPAPCLEPLAKEMRPKTDILILLYAGEFKDAATLTKAVPGFDYVVITGRFPTRGATIYREGNTRFLSVQNVQGKELGFVELGPGEQQAWAPRKEPESLFVALDLPPDSRMVELIGEFKKETQTLQVMSDPNAERIYAGAGRCSTCHREIYNDWKSTRHAHALQTLTNKGQQFNPECLVCHTTGFRQSNGFYSVQDNMSRQMTDVQCEVCHGPAKAHADIEQKVLAKADKWMSPADYQAMLEQRPKVKPRKEVPAEVCLKCHTPANDNNFVYDVKMPKINHAQAREKLKTEAKPAEADKP